MRIFVDANVILDVIMERQPFADDSRAFLALCSKRKAALAPHTVANIFFISRKKFSTRERKAILLGILSYIDIVPTGRHQIIQALQNDAIDDFEDALQLECAKEFNADFIVTRDPEHFIKSEIETISPSEFVEKYGGQE